MATEILVKQGTQISFGNHTGDFVGGATKTKIETGTPTDVQIDLTSLGAGAGRESDKFDFGATRAARFGILGTLEFATAPFTGEMVNLYLAPSPDSAAANGNIQSIDGVDAAAPSGHSTLAELTSDCQHIGSFVCSTDATGTVQNFYGGTFSPTERYGILIVVNDTSDAMHSAAVECNIVFTPIIDEAQ